jgi:hypothetical protein
MVATLWEMSPHQNHSPASLSNFDKLNDIHPLSIKQIASGLAEFQKNALTYIENEIKRKLIKGHGSSENIREKLYAKLTHEQYSLKNYDTLCNDLLRAFGWNQDYDLKGIIEGFFSEDKTIITLLKKSCEEVLDKVKKRLKDFSDGKDSIEAIQEKFLKRVGLPKINSTDMNEYELHTNSDFSEIAYVAERERSWSSDDLKLARELARLKQASEIASTVNNDPQIVYNLLITISDFMPNYLALEKLPKAIVTQNNHSDLIFEDEQGRAVFFNLDDLSLDIRIADLARLNIKKILGHAVAKDISLGEAKNLVNAAFAGFNTYASPPLSTNEKTLASDYLLASFLNHLPQFGVILNLEEQDLDRFNLAMTLETFLRELKELQNLQAYWKAHFAP